MQTTDFVVAEDFANWRLRKFVTLNCRNILVHRGDISNAFRNNSILINGAVGLDSRILTVGDLVTIRIDEKQTTVDRLASLGVKVIWDSDKNVSNLSSVLSTTAEPAKEPQQMIVFWKPAGVSITELQNAAWAFSSIPNSVEVSENSEPNSLLEMQDFINCSLQKRYKNRVNGFIIVNQMEKAAYGLVIALSGSMLVKWFETSTHKKKIQFEYTGLCHGDFSTIWKQPNLSNSIPDSSNDKPTVLVTDETSRWLSVTGLPLNSFDFIRVNHTSATKSLASKYISKVNFTITDLYSGGLVIRKYMDELGFSIIGNNKLTKPLKNSSDKGLLLALTAVKIDQFPGVSCGVLHLKHEEPLKFETIIARETKFYNKKIEKRADELENVLVSSNLSKPIDPEIEASKYDPNYDIPVSYITMKKAFHGHIFNVSRDTLIPRSSTEALVDSAIEVIEKQKPFNSNNSKILDLGTGSGCVLVSILLNYPDKPIFGVGLDLSEAALDVAKKNSEALGTFNKTEFMSLDFSKMHNSKQLSELGPFDIIVCNPPYISSSDHDRLNTSTTSFEPSVALFAGNDKYKCYEQIRDSLEQSLTSTQNKSVVRENTVIIFEIGKNMEKGVKSIFKNWAFLKSWKDSQGLIRCVGFTNNRLVSGN